MKNRVYILGGAQSDFQRNWTKEGKNEIALLKEVVGDALLDAGLSEEELHKLNEENRAGCFVGNFIAEKYVGQGHLGALLTEVSPVFYGMPSARYEAACASGSVALDAAVTKIENGNFDVAVVVGWELMKTVDSRTGGDFLGFAAYYDKECRGVAFPFPSLFGRLADEIIARYSLDRKPFMEALAMISAKNYANAKRNPLAQTRDWFMSLEQAMDRGSTTNPLVGGPLAASDCSQVTEGAAVVILVSERIIREKGAKRICVRGYGHRVAPMLFSRKMEEAKSSPYILPWTRRAVLDAYARSGLRFEDMDFFETHDCFTSSEFAALSAFGIAAPGRELDVLERGLTEFDGPFPVNASGGLIGCGHPVGASGVRMFLDLYKQVAEKAGTYQLAKARTGMMLNIGGSATTNFVYIVGRGEG